MNSYSELLKRPEWQKKRLEIMQRDGFRCRECGSTEKTLHVHHLIYEKGMKPWEYHDHCYITLCECCHVCRGRIEKLLKDCLKFTSTKNLSNLICLISLLSPDTLDAELEKLINRYSPEETDDSI